MGATSNILPNQNKYFLHGILINIYKYKQAFVSKLLIYAPVNQRLPPKRGKLHVRNCKLGTLFCNALNYLHRNFIFDAQPGK